jgi:hypothetical protein
MTNGAAKQDGLCFRSAQLANSGEQRPANRDRRQHRADNAEPLLVGRRIGNSAVQPVAHGIPRLTSAVVPSPVSANACAGQWWRQLRRVARAREKAAQCSFLVTAQADIARSRSSRWFSLGHETEKTAAAFEQGRLSLIGALWGIVARNDRRTDGYPFVTQRVARDEAGRDENALPSN